jgi:hypothetical protein
MEFPITKIRLQNNIADELNRLNIEKYISEIIEYLTHKIIKEASRKIQHANVLKNLHIPINSINVEQPENCRRPMILEYIPEILNKLQQRFPDTIICLDPMKTYFFIDWS